MAIEGLDLVSEAIREKDVEVVRENARRVILDEVVALEVSKDVVEVLDQERVWAQQELPLSGAARQ